MAGCHRKRLRKLIKQGVPIIRQCLKSHLRAGSACGKVFPSGSVWLRRCRHLSYPRVGWRKRYVPEDSVGFAASMHLLQVAPMLKKVPDHLQDRTARGVFRWVLPLPRHRSGLCFQPIRASQRAGWIHLLFWRCMITAFRSVAARLSFELNRLPVSRHGSVSCRLSAVMKINIQPNDLRLP